MKTIQKERVSHYEMYIANDGTEFDDRDECKKYDESAAGVLSAMLQKIVVKESNEERLFDFGCSDNLVQVLAPTSEEDKKTILQLYLLKNSLLDDEECNHYVERASKLIDRAIKEKDYLLVGRGYDWDGFWFYGTRHSMQEQLDFFCKPDENKENA